MIIVHVQFEIILAMIIIMDSFDYAILISTKTIAIATCIYCTEYICTLISTLLLWVKLSLGYYGDIT